MQNQIAYLREAHRIILRKLLFIGINTTSGYILGHGYKSNGMDL